jgi:hypothetical protein
MSKTQVIVIGNKCGEAGAEPIELRWLLSNVDPDDYDNETLVEEGCDPSEFKYIELVCKNYNRGYDLMFAYDNPDDRSGGCLYVGHFNDGVVE